MLKQLIKRIFLKIYDIKTAELDEEIKNIYTSLGMVKPENNKVKYYATPTLTTKCLKASRKKYGFKEGDSIEKMFDDVYAYYETIIE